MVGTEANRMRPSLLMTKGRALDDVDRLLSPALSETSDAIVVGWCRKIAIPLWLTIVERAIDAG